MDSILPVKQPLFSVMFSQTIEFSRRKNCELIVYQPWQQFIRANPIRRNFTSPRAEPIAHPSTLVYKCKRPKCTKPQAMVKFETQVSKRLVLLSPRLKFPSTTSALSSAICKGATNVRVGRSSGIVDMVQRHQYTSGASTRATYNTWHGKRSKGYSTWWESCYGITESRRGRVMVMESVLYSFGVIRLGGPIQMLSEPSVSHPPIALCSVAGHRR